MNEKERARITNHILRRIDEITDGRYTDSLVVLWLTNRKTGAEIAVPGLRGFDNKAILGYVPDWGDWDGVTYGRNDNPETYNLWSYPLGRIDGGGKSVHPKVVMLDPDNPPVELRDGRTGIDVSV